MQPAAYAFDRYEKYNNQRVTYKLHDRILHKSTNCQQQFHSYQNVIIIIEIIIYYHSCWDGLNYSYSHNHHPVHPLGFAAGGAARVARGVHVCVCVYVIGVVVTLSSWQIRIGIRWQTTMWDSTIVGECRTTAAAVNLLPKRDGRA